MNLVPFALYFAAFIAYAWHFARRSPALGRTATTMLAAAALAHTFIIGMRTMEVGQVPVFDATSAISMFVWLLAVANLYTEVTTDERAMGVFILILILALQSIPAFKTDVEVRSSVLRGPVFGIHVSSLLFAERRHVDAEHRSAEDGRSHFDVGLECGNALQRENQYQDEDAHRPLVRRHFRVEVRDGQQPHEHRDGRG